MRINQNIMANNAYRNLSTTNMSLGKSLEKLSSGFRINRAADDAAGLVISQGLRAQVSGLRQATRNAQDGISVVQTAEGALNEVHTILNRMRDLSVQSANTGSNDPAARSAAQAEITALTEEVNRISDKTAFGGTNLLDGTYGVSAATTSGTGGTVNTLDVDDFTIVINGGPAITIADLALAGDASVATSTSDAKAVEAALNNALKDAGSIYGGKVSVSAKVSGLVTDSDFGALTIKVAGLKDGEGFTIAGATALTALGTVTGIANDAAGTGGTFQIGANSGDTVEVKLADTDATALLGAAPLDVTTATAAGNAITRLDLAISTVSTTRGNIGALQNRFESMINNLQVTTENLVASESRIRDTDMAAEMTNFTKNQILSQAGTAMLAQANQVPQSILSLLR